MSELELRPIKETKAALRKEMRAVLRSLDDVQRGQAGRQACDRLREQRVWREARAILGYAPVPPELDIWPMVAEGLAAGKLVCLPRYVREIDHYEAAQIREPQRDLQPGNIGIREPAIHCAAIPLNRLDLILVPGVAFAVNGARLGRGQGYYDHLLATFEGIKCGVSFDEQVLSTLPTEPHDIHLDCILTPTRWLVAGRGPV